MAKETKLPALLPRATSTMQPATGHRSPREGDPELGGPRAWRSQPRPCPRPFPSAGRPVRTRSVAAPRRSAPLRRCSTASGARSRGCPCPPLGSAWAASPPPAPRPRGTPRPPHAPQPLSQGRFGLRSRHSRGGAGGAGKEGGEGTGRVGSALWRPSFGVEPPFLSSGCTCLSPDPLAPIGIQAGAALGQTELGAEGGGQGPNFGVGDALTHLDAGRVRQGSQRRYREAASALFLADCCLPAKQNRAASPPHYLPQKRHGTTGT